MKVAMGRSVYKKLRAQYGNSFHNVITHYSNSNFKQDEYQNHIKATCSPVLDEIDVRESQINNGLGIVVDICSGINSVKDDGIAYKGMKEFHFLTDGNLKPGECINSSEKVQREIEGLAERITRSIIGAKGME